MWKKTHFCSYLEAILVVIFKKTVNLFVVQTKSICSIIYYFLSLLTWIGDRGNRLWKCHGKIILAQPLSNRIKKLMIDAWFGHMVLRWTRKPWFELVWVLIHCPYIHMFGQVYGVWEIWKAWPFPCLLWASGIVCCLPLYPARMSSNELRTVAATRCILNVGSLPI